MAEMNNHAKKNHSGAILLTALLLGLAMPFGIFFSLQNGQDAPAAVCFVLLAIAMGLIAWKG